MHSVLRRITIVGTPLVLGALDVFHPSLFAQEGIMQRIEPVVNWWLLLHILQLPLFCLLALSVYLLLDDIHHLTATISRVALAVFVIFYPAFDGLIGIGIGTLVRYASTLPAQQHAFISNIIDAFWQSPLAYLLAAIGSVGWSVALLMAVLALAKPLWPRWFIIVLAVLSQVAIPLGQALSPFSPVWLAIIVILSIAFGFAFRPHVPVGLLLMASFLFATTHAPPFGPLGLACFLLAALQLEIVRRKARAVPSGVAPAL